MFGGGYIRFVFWGLLVAMPALWVGTAAAEPITVDSAVLEKLQQVIQQQQEQLNSLKKQVDDLQKAAAEAQSQAKEAKSTAQQAVDTAKQAESVAKAPPDKVVTSGQERVRLAISGQVNRAVNVIDDGKNTAVYYVDNDASNSRLRFVGTAQATDDLTIGSRIEFATAPNESADVSQNDEESGDFTDQRWAEVSLTSKRFGMLSVGKGSTASDNSAEVDLSGTDVVQYASVADIAAGMLFRQNSDTLTDVTLSDAFSDLDGLGRRSRVRYDTPRFYGFKLAASAVSDQRWDSSLWWGGQGYGFKAAAAAAISDPNLDNTDYQYDGSFSVLHESTGLNLTASGGLRERDGQGDQSNFYIKGGWLTRLFAVGSTAFGVDYDRSINFPTGRDDGYSIGAAVVQQIENYGTELYLQYRLYSLDRGAEPGVQDMNVGTFGARVKF